MEGQNMRTKCEVCGGNFLANDICYRSTLYGTECFHATKSFTTTLYKAAENVETGDWLVVDESNATVRKATPADMGTS
jgi:hypothetical protein